ncbi:MAG TPA: hypothetical protein VFA86_14030 [Gammaproteobacteria bacterium]|nr:hypothetical protein [Gammaproteobacteria bacterium]
MHQVVAGFTLFFRATGTWWIPMRLLPGVWRYLVKRFPFTCHPLYRGMASPQGMHTVCTARLATAPGPPFLERIPRVFAFAALVARAARFLGRVFQGLLPALRARPAAEARPRQGAPPSNCTRSRSASSSRSSSSRRRSSARSRVSRSR